MDKRWIAILVIFVIGVSCLFFIAETSNTVGSAIADVNKAIVTMPHDFSKEDSDSNSLLLKNKGTNEKILIEDLGKNDTALDEFNSKIQSFSGNPNILNMKNKTNETGNFKVYTIYYNNATQTNTTNAISYVYKINHTFYIKMVDFKNTDNLDSDLNFIIETLQPDYKRSQD